MDACALRLVLVFLVSMATVTQAMNYLALPRMGRSGYLAFPRMGRRGYLAFPRMGRSGGEGGSELSQDGADCCRTGLKTEWVPEEGGTTTTQDLCHFDSCCLGWQEVVDQKPDGVFYSMCIPTCSSSSSTSSSSSSASSEEALNKMKSEDTSRNVLQKLKELLHD